MTPANELAFLGQGLQRFFFIKKVKEMSRLNKCDRLTFCAKYCALKKEGKFNRSPFYFWLYEDDDSAKRYHAYKEYVQQYHDDARQLKCVCSTTEEKLK
jgi:hypothetical protein